MGTVSPVNHTSKGLSSADRFFKRTFDIILSAAALLLTGWLILAAFAAAGIDTGQNGFFTQARIGRQGRRFRIIKIRTMRDIPDFDTTVTVSGDPRITALGRFFRAAKIDELPQLLNVLAGHMSFVGPRPDVEGFMDLLRDEDRILLTVRPGITGPATLKYRMEEELLARQSDPEKYNREVIFPDKVRINREYVENYSFLNDLKCIFRTITGDDGKQ